MIIMKSLKRFLKNIKKKITAIAPPHEAESTGVYTSTYPCDSSYLLSSENIFDRVFNISSDYGFVNKSRCFFLYLTSLSLRELYYGSIQRQGLRTLMSSYFSTSIESSPFFVTKADPLTPTISPLLN